MCYLKLCFKLEIFCSVTIYILQSGIIHSEIYMKTQCNNFILFLKKIDSVRTIRPSCNYVLGSKKLGSKCIKTSTCNVLANHNQNIKSRFRLLKVCLCVKLESSNCRKLLFNFCKAQSIENETRSIEIRANCFFIKFSNSA